MVVFSTMKTNAAKVFLVALSISDFLFCTDVLFNSPLNFLIKSYVAPVDQNLHLCRISALMNHMLPRYSISVMFLLTVERCVAVFLPMEMTLRCTVKRALIMCIIACCLYFIYSLAFVMHFISFHKKDLCFWSLLLYQNIVHHIFDMLPMILIFVMNIFLIVKLCQRNSLSSENVHGNVNRHAVILSLLASVSDTLLFVPKQVFTRMEYGVLIEQQDTAGVDQYYTAQGSAEILYTAGFALNFVMYNVGSSMYRKKLRELCQKVFCSCRRISNWKPECKNMWWKQVVPCSIALCSCGCQFVCCQHEKT